MLRSTRARVAVLGLTALFAPAQVMTAQEPPPSPPPPGLLRQIGDDFRRFASRGTLLTLGLGGAASLAVHPRDRQITDSFQGSAGLDRFFEIGDVAGGGLIQGGTAVATFAAGLILHKQGAADLGRDLVRAQVLNGILTLALKLAVRRERPDGSSRTSFPSGHSSAAFATATVLERRYGWKLGVPAYAFAAYVAASRLQENKHFPSDVVFGGALGIAAGRSVSVTRGKQAATVGPAFFVQGPGLALSLTWGRP